jgi:ADP-ribosylglycohydrolase
MDEQRIGAPSIDLCVAAQHARGADTDAAMTGAFAGAWLGVNGIPAQWRGWLPPPAAEHLGETAEHLAALAESIAASETFERAEIED